MVLEEKLRLIKDIRISDLIECARIAGHDTHHTHVIVKKKMYIEIRGLFGIHYNPFFIYDINVLEKRRTKVYHSEQIINYLINKGYKL